MAVFTLGLILFISASIAEFRFRVRDYKNTSDHGVVVYDSYNQKVLYQSLRYFLVFPTLLLGVYLVYLSVATL